MLLLLLPIELVASELLLHAGRAAHGVVAQADASQPPVFLPEPPRPPVLPRGTGVERVAGDGAPCRSHRCGPPCAEGGAAEASPSPSVEAAAVTDDDDVDADDLPLSSRPPLRLRGSDWASPSPARTSTRRALDSTGSTRHLCCPPSSAPSPEERSDESVAGQDLS